MIDIAEILRDFPKGTELYSPIFGKCALKNVLNNVICVVIKCNNFTASFTQYGQYGGHAGECLLFPSKDNRYWSTLKPCQFKPFDKAVCRFDEETRWRIDFFSYYDKEDEDFPYQCIGGAYQDCLPYNEETAKLIGTMDECGK